MFLSDANTFFCFFDSSAYQHVILLEVNKDMQPVFEERIVWVKQQLYKIKYPKTVATFPFRDSQTVKHAYFLVEHVLTI